MRAGLLAAVVIAAVGPMVFPLARRNVNSQPGGTAKTREIQRYRPMTQEQADWNAAIDEKKKARKP